MKGEGQTEFPDWGTGNGAGPAEAQRGPEGLWVAPLEPSGAPPMALGWEEKI